MPTFYDESPVLSSEVSVWALRVAGPLGAALPGTHWR